MKYRLPLIRGTSYNRTRPQGADNKKNWKALFNGLWDIEMVNAYLVSHHSPNGVGYHSSTAFRRKLYQPLWEDAGPPNWEATESLLGKRKRVTIGEDVWGYRKQTRCAFRSLNGVRALEELSAYHVAQ